ncbi:hypothetical protein LTR56_016151 [Elasticomyces elasticus]|nr:hypothetical protein LTR22_022016 [Elasticomyces elasticus]KAK3629818.1 hypothetical protein LTR56_017831 [Elasticomyces elasticus]KAK3632828.1 hypothetical protein LTR56_016151 [Elasticomyces elasticus]KAK3637905.1 hypothetical protein LTR22_018043 [Elasticomyces elasticus]KAK4908673.1 hypothetical protein LTR49_022485 [Elasticomyces elasticus]
MAPSRSEIEKLASHLATSDPSPFFERVSPDVVWDVMESWKKGALGVINERLKEPLKLKVVNVLGGGDQDWATVELEANSVCKNGMEYPQRYAWVMRFDENGTIVQVRAYLDSALVQKAVDQNP